MALIMKDGKEIRVPGKAVPEAQRREGALGTVDGMHWRKSEKGKQPFRDFPLLQQHIFLAEAWHEKGREDKVKASRMKIYDSVFKMSEIPWAERLLSASRIAKKYGLGEEKVKEPALRVYNEYFNRFYSESDPDEIYKTIASRKERALEIAKEYGLGEEKIKEAAESVFWCELGKGNEWEQAIRYWGYSGGKYRNSLILALSIAKKYQLGQEKINTTGRSLCEYNIRNEEGLYDLQEIAKTYGFVREIKKTARKICSEKIENAIYVKDKEYEYKKALEIARHYLSRKELIGMALAVCDKLKTRAGSELLELALEIAEKYKLDKAKVKELKLALENAIGIEEKEDGRRETEEAKRKEKELAQKLALEKALYLSTLKPG